MRQGKNVRGEEGRRALKIFANIRPWMLCWHAPSATNPVLQSLHAAIKLSLCKTAC